MIRKAITLLSVSIFAAVAFADAKHLPIGKVISFHQTNSSPCTKQYVDRITQAPRVGSAIIAEVPSSKVVFDDQPWIFTSAHVPFHSNQNVCHLLVTDQTGISELQLFHVDLSKDLAIYKLGETAKDKILPRLPWAELNAPLTLDQQTRITTFGYPINSLMLRSFTGTMIVAKSDQPAFSFVQAMESSANSIIGMSGGGAFKTDATGSKEFVGLISAHALMSMRAGRIYQLARNQYSEEFGTFPLFASLMIRRDSIAQYAEEIAGLGTKAPWFSLNAEAQRSNVNTLTVANLKLTEVRCNQPRKITAAIGGDFAGNGGDFAGNGGDFAGNTETQAVCAVRIELSKDKGLDWPSAMVPESLKTLHKTLSTTGPITVAKVRKEFLTEHINSIFTLLGNLQSGYIVDVNDKEEHVELITEQDATAKTSNSAKRLSAQRQKQRSELLIAPLWNKLTERAKTSVWRDLSIEERGVLLKMRDLMQSQDDVRILDQLVQLSHYEAIKWFFFHSAKDNDFFSERPINLSADSIVSECMWAGADLSLRGHLERAFMMIARSEELSSDKLLQIRSLLKNRYPYTLPRVINIPNADPIPLCTVLRSELKNINAENGYIKKIDASSLKFSVPNAKAYVLRARVTPIEQCQETQLAFRATTSLQAIGETSDGNARQFTFLAPKSAAPAADGNSIVFALLHDEAKRCRLEIHAGPLATVEDKDWTRAAPESFELNLTTPSTLNTDEQKYALSLRETISIYKSLDTFLNSGE